MYMISQDDFETLVTEAIGRLPEPYKSSIANVAFFVEEEPTPDQRQRLNLRPCQFLFGLYEGVPLPARHGNNGNLLPDRITIFKRPHELFADNKAQMRIHIANTVWHEVAHYFGLDHDRIDELQGRKS